jgi:histidinol-phosphatase (PHP family)
VDDLDVYYPEYWAGKSVFQAERRYLEATLDCVRVHDDFDVLAHLTYIAKTHCHPAPRPVPFAEHRELIDEILRTLADKGKGMEMNTSGVNRCGGYLPTADYFRRFKELGGEIVTVGSDAHTADRVGEYTFEACEILKDIFGYVCTFEDRKPVFHKL